MSERDCACFCLFVCMQILGFEQLRNSLQVNNPKTQAMYVLFVYNRTRDVCNNNMAHLPLSYHMSYGVCARACTCVSVWPLIRMCVRLRERERPLVRLCVCFNIMKRGYMTG